MILGSLSSASLSSTVKRLTPGSADGFVLSDTSTINWKPNSVSIYNNSWIWKASNIFKPSALYRIPSARCIYLMRQFDLKARDAHTSYTVCCSLSRGSLTVMMPVVSSILNHSWSLPVDRNAKCHLLPSCGPCTTIRVTFPPILMSCGT